MNPRRGLVVVTGSSGAIGAATVDRFGAEGLEVLGLDRAVGDANRSGATVDLTDESAVADALKQLGDMPPLRHVVAVAGGALPEEPKTQDEAAGMSVDGFRASVEQNLTSQFITVRACLPYLRTEGGIDRSITLTSSFNALSGYGMPAYSAAKAGLIGMMRAMAPVLGRDGIRINVVAPGTIRTPRTEAIWSHVPDHFEELAESTSLGRLGEPKDVANVYRSLALEMTHVTGQVIVVDGGQLVKR